MYSRKTCWAKSGALKNSSIIWIPLPTHPIQNPRNHLLLRKDKKGQIADFKFPKIWVCEEDQHVNIIFYDGLAWLNSSEPLFQEIIQSEMSLNSRSVLARKSASVHLSFIIPYAVFFLLLLLLFFKFGYTVGDGGFLSNRSKK